MTESRKPNQAAHSSSIDIDDNSIEKITHYRLNEVQMKMIKIGGITNILEGIFVIYIMRNQIPHSILSGWYLALVVANLINIGFSFFCESSHVTHDTMKPWILVYHIIIAVICLIWGSMVVLFATDIINYQLFLMIILQAVLFGFSFGTVTDFTATVVSIFCLLLPNVSYSIYLVLYGANTTSSVAMLNYAFSLSSVILGIFLLVTCYMFYKSIKRSFRLSLVNMSLNEKLENMNKSLELRVKERTVELENSLKLVTYQAEHDLLTDLPNQRLLLDYLGTAIVSAKQGKHMFGVIFFSLNEIEKINDGLGYLAGDTVIRTVAQRFRNIFAMDSFHTVRYAVTLSRKDIFVILLDPIFKLNEVEKRVEALFAVLEDPIYADKQALKLTASIGVSIYPRDGKDIKSLLMNADAAMAAAKKQGGNALSVYQMHINVDISKQLELERNLHTALRNNEFILQYQPVVDLKTGRISGAEALVRWQSPVLGYVAPANFIPAAEANGVIIPLGEWVFRTACVQAKKWHDMGFSNLRVAINVSAKQLIKKTIVETITKILAECELDPKYIELELTESIAFLDEVVPILKEFKKMGLGLSIDDFGTGYSGLSNIKLFTIDTLKIDKSFIQDVDINKDSRAIVANTVTLAKKINVEIVGEGVETKEQLNFLKECGCDLIQGYYFSPPVNADSFTKLLESQEPFVI